MNNMNNNDKVNTLFQRVSDGINDVFVSEDFREYLRVMSRFHTYSARNSLLILMANPNATLVAGYQSWIKNFGRYVKKGEKGIPIFAYTPFTCIEKTAMHDEAGGSIITETQREVSAYKVVHVYDISQTEGTPLPVIAKELSSSVQDYEVLLDTIKLISPYSIKFESLDRIKGYCDPDNGLIVINRGMSESQTLKTLIHEVVHALKHSKSSVFYDDENDRIEEEIEAECCAFVVCEHYGVDTSEYSFPYMAAWSKDKDSSCLLRLCKSIQIISDDIISKIEHYSIAQKVT
ncbi:MAG: ArdC-like ssDNA-binding domain-containing protein [Oscillospiraceae bacterium]|nr:ArdC-like ssDNA-binding domain-containing protein [Oscillospiraceae bacterium]